MRRMFWVGLVLMTLAPACASRTAGSRETTFRDPVQQVSAQELFNQGVALAQAGDLVRSEQYLATAMMRGYPDEQVLPLLLRVCVAGSRLRLALGYAEPYLRRHPGDWSLRLLVATIHHGMGRTGRAVGEIERVVALAPDQPEAHYLLGTMLRERGGDSRRARRHWSRYLELAPEGIHASEVRQALIERQAHPADAGPRHDEPDQEPSGEPSEPSAEAGGIS